jgi:5-methylcytosine-specific restriction endonuclease McrA|nr:MAG TPA: HNH endonuclease [Caudoviricetes sp.]
MPYSAPERCWCGELGLPGTALCLAHTPTKSGWELRPTAWLEVDNKTRYKWQKLRKRFLKQNPYCNLCGMIATEVDHIQGIKIIKNKIKILDENELQSLCHECHSKKTREASRKSRMLNQNARRGNSP